MGQTESRLQRRNTIARRSQKRTLTAVKSKADDLKKRISRFRGTTATEEYQKILTEIEHLQVELDRKSKNLMKENEPVLNTTQRTINELKEGLVKKLNQNVNKQKEKEEKRKGRNEGSVVVENDDVMSTVTSQGQEAESEINDDSTPNNRRKTLVQFVQFQPAPNETEIEVHHEPRPLSPEEKRKSVMKVGVPVMPQTMMNEISRQSHHIKDKYESFSGSMEAPEKKVERLALAIKDLEEEIAEFVGRKHGKVYNDIKERLNTILVELTQIDVSNDEELLENMKQCKNYVGSCLSFLDERSIEVLPQKVDTSVGNGNGVGNFASPEAEKKLKQLTRSTAI